jgi:hypothetical protein
MSRIPHRHKLIAPAGNAVKVIGRSRGAAGPGDSVGRSHNRALLTHRHKLTVLEGDAGKPIARRRGIALCPPVERIGLDTLGLQVEAEERQRANGGLDFNKNAPGFARESVLEPPGRNRCD